MQNEAEANVGNLWWHCSSINLFSLVFNYGHGHISNKKCNNSAGIPKCKLLCCDKSMFLPTYLYYLQNQWLHFENRLKKLESSLNKNHNDVGEIKQAIRQIIAPEDSHPLGNIQEGPEEVKHDFPPASAIIYNQTCSISLHQTPKNHVQVRIYTICQLIFYVSFILI